jgi:hypothetical protein
VQHAGALEVVGVLRAAGDLVGGVEADLAAAEDSVAVE